MKNSIRVGGRQALSVLVAAFAAAIFVACAPMDQPTAQQLTGVNVKGTKANAGECDLTVALAAGANNVIEANTDFDVPFTVTNNGDTDCYTEPAASVVSGTGLTLQSPAQTPNGFFEIDAGDSASVVGHFHTLDYQRRPGSVSMTMTSGQADTLIILMTNTM